MKKLKNFIENNYIRMNYVCLCLVISVSLAIGFFLYGLTIDCLTDFVGMIIVFIGNILKIKLKFQKLIKPRILNFNIGEKS